MWSLKTVVEAWFGATPRRRESHDVYSRAGDVAHPEKEWFRKILDRHYTKILDYLEPKLLLDKFIESEFLPERTIRDINDEKITSAMSREIVQKVKSAGENGYKMFKECLLRSGQFSLCNFLDKVEKGEDEDLNSLHQGVEMERKTRERKEKRKDKLVYEKRLDVMEEILTKLIKKQKDFTRHEDISERFDIQGHFSRECCDILKKIFEEDEASDRQTKVVDAVKEIINLIKTKISQADIENNNCVKITVPCRSSYEMRRILKTLRGNDFQEGVDKLTKALGETYDGSIAVKAKIEIQKFGEALDSFRDQGIIDDKDKNVSCDTHSDIPSSFYCPAHEAFSCEECAHNVHRACTGVRQSTADFNILKTHDLSPNHKREYRVRVDEQELCSTFKSCILPNGEILLADNCNNRLKKLDIYYNVIGHCIFTEPPSDICTVENGTVLISFGFYVQFVDVENDIEPKEKVVLKNTCFQIAWHNGLLFYSDKSSIYKCDADGKRQTLAYTMKNKNITCKRFVISNDGDKMFIATGKNGLLIVDIANETEEDINQTISINRELLDCTDVVNVNDKFMLACDFKSQAVWLISTEDGRIIRKIVEKSNGLRVPWSISFDNADCTVMVGRLGKDFISVFEVQLNNG